jgi:hypothetical protein
MRAVRKLLTKRQAVFGDGSIHALDFGYETDLAVVWTFSFYCTNISPKPKRSCIRRTARREDFPARRAAAVYRTPDLVSSVTWFRSRQAIMVSPNNLEALSDRPAFTRYDPSSGTGWITLAGEKKRRAFRVRGEPRISEEADAFTVSFTREMPNLVRQRIDYCALPTGEVAVFSRWQALGDIEVSELVDHPFRWVEIEKFITKPDAKQIAPGVWEIDGKLQMQVLGGTPGEIASDGLNGAVRRDFSAKAGEALQSSVCIYQPLVVGRRPCEAKIDGNTLLLGDWRHEFIE